MKNMTQLSKRKGVSPVIATVILVAVAITVSVAVAYWMGGIAGQYTKFEKVEIQSAQVTWDGSSWKVVMKIKNTGTSATTLISVFINEVEVQNYDNDNVVTNATSTSMTTTTSIESGDNILVNIYIDLGYATLSSGTTVNLKIHSSGGMDYIKLIELT